MLATNTSTTRSFGGVFTCAPGDIIYINCILFEGNFNVTYTIIIETINIETKKKHLVHMVYLQLVKDINIFVILLVINIYTYIN